MVKDIFRGFGYTLGKFIAFLFIALVIGTLLFKLDDIDFSKIPFSQLIMEGYHEK